MDFYKRYKKSKEGAPRKHSKSEVTSIKKKKFRSIFGWILFWTKERMVIKERGRRIEQIFFYWLIKKPKTTAGEGEFIDFCESVLSVGQILGEEEEGKQ